MRQDSVLNLLTLLCLSLSACHGPVAATPPRFEAVPPGDIETSLFLIGDAGAPAPKGEPVLKALQKRLSEHPDRSLVVFLGDNIYPTGLPAPENPDRPEAERRLKAQVDAVQQAGVRPIFIPGNHDWEKGEEGGWNAIRRQETFLEQGFHPGVEMLPDRGCPGPVVLDFGDRLRLIILDTQWWLHTGPRPDGPGSGCPAHTEDAVVDSLRAAIATAGGRRVVVAAHHPVVSGGEHGGHFSWMDHVFPLRALHGWLWVPLPVVGSAYPIIRRSGLYRQDIAAEVYSRLRDRLVAVFMQSPPLVYASGHEHNLQVMKRSDGPYLLISGAGILGQEDRVSRLSTTLFAASDGGFMQLDVLQDGRVRLEVLAAEKNGDYTSRYSTWLE